METQKNVSEEIATKKEDFGFVGYRDYKSSEFFKRYEEARKRIPADVIAEVKDGVAPKKPVANRKGHAIAIAVFGILYLALCVVGYFVHSEDIIIGSILAVFDGKSLVDCVLGIIDGSISDLFELIGAGAMCVSALFALLSVIGGITDGAVGRGVGKLMKTGCTIGFFCAVVGMVAVIACRLDLTIGLAVAIVVSGIIALCALCAPNKIKEKKE